MLVDKVPEFRKRPLVMLVWVDPTVRGGWKTPEEAEKAAVCECISVGFLIRRTRDQVTIANSLGAGEACYGEPFTLPKACVRKLIYLGRKK